MSKSTCIICDKKLSFWNQPIFGKGTLKSTEKVCSSCFMKINRKAPRVASNLKKYTLDEILNLLSPPKIAQVEFQVKTDTNKPTSQVNSKWEIVHRKTKRWTELGFGDGDSFPGYGKIYNREFKVWYCEIGSKEEKGEQTIQDQFPLNYEPKNSTKVTGEGVYLDRLDNSKGYESLYTALDNKNRKRWYFALLKFEPTWIETERAIEVENEEIEKEEISIPDGWELVRRHSVKWGELGYDKGFPGYGKVYDITFEVWYSNVGSKEKVQHPDISVHLALYGRDSNIYYFERVSSRIEGLNGKQLNFERLSRNQGYTQLYNGLDNSTKQRWYLGIKEMKPTSFFTASAD